MMHTPHMGKLTCGSLCGSLYSAEWVVNGDAVRPMLCIIKNEDDTTNCSSMHTCCVPRQAVNVKIERMPALSCTEGQHEFARPWQSLRVELYNMCDETPVMCLSTVTAMHKNH